MNSYILTCRFIFVMIIGLAAHTSLAQQTDDRLFPQDQVTVHGNGTTGPYTIGRQFIGGTLSIKESSNSQLTITSWDISKQTLSFDRPLAAGDSAVVVLAVPPDWLKKAYTRPMLQTEQHTINVGTSQSQRKTYPKPFPGLHFGGSKTFEVTTGTDRSVALNQTLRLNISGNITDDISLNAAISDQNIPITPEGDTRELNELDRVLIEIRGKRFSAEMGDTNLKRSSGRWQSYTRRLSGAHLRFHTGTMSVFGSGAVSEGRYMSTTIAPVEGNQGPYRLIAGDGNSHISIIPGTERVWINGIQLTRGYNYDYTIDYTSGDITFSDNRIIGSDMRIVCDYEYNTESYRRNFFSAGSDGEFFNGRLKIGMVAAQEADDPDRSVYGELDDTSRTILKAAGDSLATVTGIRSAEGDSTGTYDSIGGHLVHNPYGTGAYNVTFSWVGTNKGSYRYRGGGIYEFLPPEDRGPGSGASFEPITVIKGPVSHNLVGVNVAFDPISTLHIESEVAGSSLDKNSLSGINDSDNNGGAYRFNATVSPKIRMGVPLLLEIGGKHSTSGETFAPLDRDRSAEENRRWGLPLIIESEGETVSEMASGLTVEDGGFKGSGISFDAGSARFGDSTQSSRFGVAGTLQVNETDEANISVDRITREFFPGRPDETINRVAGEAAAHVSGFEPHVIYEGEQTEGIGSFSHGSSYDDVRLQLKNPEFFGIKSDLEWLYRLERAKNKSWSDSSTVRGGSIELSTGSGVSGSLRTRYAHRERKGFSRDFTSDQAFIEGFFRPTGGRVHVDWMYRAGRSREASRRKNYIYIGSGRGSFRWEDDNADGVRDQDEFIPDEHGTYYLYEETLDDYRPVNIVQLLSKINIDLPTETILNLGGKGLKLRSETSLEINEKSSASANDVFFLRLSQFRKEGRTTSGDARIQEDIVVPLSNGDGSLRLRLFYLDSYNAEFVSGAEQKGTTEQSLRLRLPLTGTFDSELTLKRSVKQRRMEQTVSGNFNVLSLSGDAGVSYYPDSFVSVGINAGGGYDRERTFGINVRYISLKPSFTYRFSGRGKIDTSYELTSITITKGSAGLRLPYTVARGRKAGENHDVSVMCDYRLSKRINIVITYTGRKFSDRDFENFAQAQVRTLF